MEYSQLTEVQVCTTTSRQAVHAQEAAHLVLIDVGVKQLLVAAVDDGGAIAGSKDVGDAVAVECFERHGLAAQAQLLPLTQLPCNGTQMLYNIVSKTAAKPIAPAVSMGTIGIELTEELSDRYMIIR